MNKQITYLDDDTKDLFLNKVNEQSIYRYMSIDKIELNKLWFANPKIWNDPFEKLFIDSTYKFNGQKLNYMFKNRIYCMCITTSKYSEAAWKVYESEVQFEISKSNLLEVLKNNTSKYDIYIGKVQYKRGSELSRSSPLALLNLTKNDFNYPEAWIRLLLLKRKDFSYENEIRIVLVEKEESLNKEKEGINLNYELEFTDLFPNVIIAPDIKRDREKLIIDKLLNDFFYSHELIEKNILYKEVQPRNIKIL